MAERAVVDLYVRVSTDMQAEEGYSLQEQESRLRMFAEAQGWTVLNCHRDPGFSGANMERPGLQALIADVEAGRVQKVVVYKLDRLSRDQLDVMHLIRRVFQENGVDFVSMTENFDTGTPFGLAAIGLLSIFAQLERDQIKERMMMGRIASAKEGNWRGGSGVPIGYRYLPKTATEPGRLIVDPYEAQVVRAVFAQFLRGKTYHAIYNYCRQNYTTSYGSFAGGGAALIPAMLSNRAYIGEIKYKGVWYKGKHEPIIDADTFQRAQDMMVEYRATLDEHRRKPFQTGHLLTGLLYCGECGARWCYHSCSYTKKSGERMTYGTYSCYTKSAHKGQRRADHCSIPVWPDSELEEVVWGQLFALKYEELPEKPDADAAELKACEDKIKTIEGQLERLIDLYTLGTLPLDQIQKRSQAMQADKEKLLQQCDVIRRRSTRLTREELAGALARVQEVYESGDLEEQRDLLRMLIKKITLGQDRAVSIEWNL